ncbi:Rv3212 family protein [Actinokineospora globicatena]|uniref:Rv3212 family protein n=1 Tax=Actinokineospora globicatena TaxID=103729 RepID=UPI0020A39DFA|nr:hypothetical protein [Actinokineospora globicatena]MCP2300402.1 hypothetical protein [Actinokineospora globicatena]GLW80934.1 hypothetical protein Aglo01_54150 [Actinokineospora globicatena]GLW88127.1 hypothetical protein Aglo02_57660 [Actinokineospora globicatena]
MTLGETRDGGDGEHQDPDPRYGSTGGRTAVVDEDVLAGDAPATRVRGPRNGFNTKRDWALLILIVLALVAAGVVVWQRSDIAATESKPATGSYPVLTPPEVFPPSLGEAWRVSSPATWQPVIANITAEQGNAKPGSTVVTGDGGTVAGRDPETGEVRWTYERDLDLCGLAVAWSKVVSVFRTDGRELPPSDPRSAGGCSEVTALDPTTGVRDNQDNGEGNVGQRDWDAELGSRYLFDGQDYLTATGSRLLLSLRYDLVKTQEYGEVAAKVNPGRQPRTGCEYHSVLAAAGKVAVVESCPDETSDRLTVLRAAPAEWEKPEEVTSQVLDGRGAQVIAMNNGLVAIALPNPGRVIVYNEQGERTGTFDVDLGPEDLTTDAAGHTPLVATATGAYYWYTGSRTVVLSATELRPLWTVPDTRGPGVVFGGRALVPVPEGLAVLSQADGTRIGTIPVNREGYTGPVTMATIGSMVLEQRGPTLVALH